MTIARWCLRGAAAGCCALLVILVALQARAQDLGGELRWLGQVREGDQEREREAPNVFDGDLAAAHLPYRSGVETYFRLERDFATGDGVSDFYAGFLRARPASGVDVTLGRQFLSEGPGGAFVADGGKLRVARGPVAFTLFGGLPRYFEPTYSAEIQSQDEVLFGGSVSLPRLAGGRVSLGYLQLERDENVLRQLVTGTLSRACPELPGHPDLYGAVAYDADYQNLDLATVGADLAWARARVYLNIEGSYYQPQDDQRRRPLADLDRREDAIFELFSVSEMGQGRIGVRRPLTRTVSTFADYSFQHYDQQEGREVQNGHVGGTGLLWLPGGDGLEFVRLEYYVLQTEDDSANGARGYYENRVYDRLAFRTKLDVAYYEKVNNQKDTAVSSFVGLAYEVRQGLEWEVNAEANHNERFEREFRFGFLIRYGFQHGLTGRREKEQRS